MAEHPLTAAALTASGHHRHPSSTLSSFPSCLSPPPAIPRSSAFSFTSPRKRPLHPFNPSHAHPPPPTSASKENFSHRRTTSLHHLIGPAPLHPTTPTIRHGRMRSASPVDRFIPQRDPSSPPLSVSPQSPIGSASPTSSPTSASPTALTPSQLLHNEELAAGLLSPGQRTNRTLSFHASSSGGREGGGGSPMQASHHRAMSQQVSHTAALRAMYTSASHPSPSTAHPVLRPSVERILDAPQLLDDYYLNLLDWSSTGLLAIALGTAVYLWDPVDSSIRVLVDLSSSSTPVTALRFSADGLTLAVGCDDAATLLLDVQSQRRLRCWRAHDGRVGSLSFNRHLLSSGARDGRLVHADVRAKPVVSVWDGAHEEEVCGLAWSPDGRLLASGANDNLCKLWSASDLAASSPTSALRGTLREHTAAVKALAWCPTSPQLLATGGGTSDRHIRIYDTAGVGGGAQARLLSAVDSASQVCSLGWHPTRGHLVSAHGYSEHHLIVWEMGGRGREAGGLMKLCELQGHTARVLHSAVSPDGTRVCSAGADETMRLWKVWDELPAQRKSQAQHHHRMRSALVSTIR